MLSVNRMVVHVRLADDRTFSGRVMGRDTKTDLAVVRINAPNLHALKFGDSDELMVGDWVLAVGAPFWFGLHRGPMEL
jgi:serine protease Do